MMMSCHGFHRKVLSLGREDFLEFKGKHEKVK